LWLIKVWFSASTFVVKIATFAKPENVGCKLKKHHGTEFLIDNCYDKKFNYGIQT
jgi:hypothetical protein